MSHGGRAKDVEESIHRIEARSARPILVDGDHVVINWQFVFHHSSGAVIRLDELARQTWRGDKLARERFYYDADQMRS